ncbi:unnamed protein product [Protopolystoma xenopodis]|uniref:Uncharacterized protein n=1 Tax=Protopolystoma xenopodis TaxID=117903 RepID=A0A3S5C613_9PLAT|nr:unnamed protein product [Protopolystoma xenopodis]
MSPLVSTTTRPSKLGPAKVEKAPTHISFGSLLPNGNRQSGLAHRLFAAAMPAALTTAENLSQSVPAQDRVLSKYAGKLASDYA